MPLLIVDWKSLAGYRYHRLVQHYAIIPQHDKIQTVTVFFNDAFTFVSLIMAAQRFPIMTAIGKPFKSSDQK